MIQINRSQYWGLGLHCLIVEFVLAAILRSLKILWSPWIQFRKFVVLVLKFVVLVRPWKQKWSLKLKVLEKCLNI